MLIFILVASQFQVRRGTCLVPGHILGHPTGHLQLGEVDQQQCERVQGQPLDVCQVNHLKLYSHTLLIFSFLSTSPRHKLTKTKTKKIVQNGDFFSQ